MKFLNYFQCTINSVLVVAITTKIIQAGSLYHLWFPILFTPFVIFEWYWVSKIYRKNNKQ